MALSVYLIRVSHQDLMLTLETEQEAGRGQREGTKRRLRDTEGSGYANLHIFRHKEKKGIGATSDFARSEESMEDTRSLVPGDRGAQEGGAGAETPDIRRLILPETV